MRNGKTLLDQVNSKLQALSNDSPTEVGPKTSKIERETNSNDEHRFTPDHVDAINHMFTEFELAYHNQYHKAFSNNESLGLAKQLWLRNLASFEPKRIIQAARKAISQSEYLPTIHSILKYCEPQLPDYGLPEPRQAYYEACRASSPKAEYQWSHPAVYFAGRGTDWFFIANNSENRVFPVFERNYKILCERVLNGEEIEIEIPKAIPDEISQPLSNQERKQRMKSMRKELGI